MTDVVDPITGRTRSAEDEISRTAAGDPDRPGQLPDPGRPTPVPDPGDPEPIPDPDPEPMPLPLPDPTDPDAPPEIPHAGQLEGA